VWAALAAGVVVIGIPTLLIAAHAVHDAAYDDCTFTPPWYDVPRDAVVSVKWKLFPPDATCEYTLADGRVIERDWSEPPWDKLPAKWTARILSESGPSVARVTCRPSERLDYACTYASGRRVFVRVDRTSIEEYEPG
jgi:hypothetical protein